ncbi:MAG TPA: alpha-2-macroglobulin family protein, partial [Puia sp.]|nr:alpha-2-macroglobulin family protein [Puia sp.]
KPGKCTLVIASVGYVVKQVSAEVPENGFIDLNISLAVSSQNLQEVVVTGYSVSSKKDLSYSISTMKGDELSLTDTIRYTMLAGRAAGVQITNDGEPGSKANIMLRGISTLSPGQHPLFLIDGIMYDEMPGNISPDMIASADVLIGAEATNIYGSKGANGVVVISTKTKNLRTQFRDYAFWQPELFTDKDGRVKFSVEYPDNVTGWQTYILGMDKKRRMGKSFSFIKSYKPLIVQISTPQFLIAGDTVEIIGKSLNYSNDDYSIKSSFIINGQSSVEKEILLKSKESGIGKHALFTPLMDTLETSFHIKSSTGFKDGEEKKIPVFQKGSLEAKGQFWVLDRDTTVSFKPDSGNKSIECFAQNNTLDILLDEIDHVKKYPYYCMEQTASKLRVLLTEKKIREKLSQKFDEDKTIHLLEDKLQKNQLFDGGWGWWGNGKTNLFITNYIINALLPIRSEGMIETNIRNGLLYLQNQLPALHNEELLSALSTMSEAKHLINYQTWLSKIDFDSLNIHQQWEFVKIMQSQQMEYTNELNKLIHKGIHGVLGSLHWGEENYRWYSDADATTVVAFEVLQKEKNSQKELNAMVQYFLEQRRTGYWHNTVASASIVSALLPYVLSSYKDFNQPTVLTITGDTIFAIKQYPFKLVMHNPNANEFYIHKTGGGLTYLTFYQQAWNENPEPVTKYFDIHSYFEKNGQKISYLHSGQKIKMIVEVNALKESDYVMVEMPIPAGCVYASKEQDDWTMHNEFLKNKVIIFSEKMNTGIHYFEVELESRYNGTFTINPAKISLMYFPVFYGRNGMKEIEIRPEKTE